MIQRSAFLENSKVERSKSNNKKIQNNTRHVEFCFSFESVEISVANIFNLHSVFVRFVFVASFFLALFLSRSLSFSFAFARLFRYLSSSFQPHGLVPFRPINNVLAAIGRLLRTPFLIVPLGTSFNIKVLCAYARCHLYRYLSMHANGIRCFEDTMTQLSSSITRYDFRRAAQFCPTHNFHASHRATEHFHIMRHTNADITLSCNAFTQLDLCVFDA